MEYMFRGEYSHHLDGKGRVIIPARYRPKLRQGAILTRGLDHNLVIYPHESWQIVTDQLNQLPMTHPSTRALRRLLFSGAVELSLDRQGRMLIPGYLRTYASLDGEVLIAGMENCVEIWEPVRWRATLDNVPHTLAQAKHLVEIGL